VLIAETHRTGRPVVTDSRRVARHSIAVARHKPASEAKGLANGCNIPQVHHRPRTVGYRGGDADRPCKFSATREAEKPLAFQQEETP
jgi:hypothetical protein